MPTVILQDLVMRETHGFDLIQRYRDEDELKHIPVVVLSAMPPGGTMGLGRSRNG